MNATLTAMRYGLSVLLIDVLVALAGCGSDEGDAPATSRPSDLDRRLIAAAYRNDVAEARRLIRGGADVNAKDRTTQSAYLISTSEGYLRLLELTLRNGAQVNDKDSYNGTGLIRAADRGHVEIVRELLRTEMDVNHVNRLGWTALLEAIILGHGGPRHTEVVRLLLEGGADPNLADSRGVTPLEHARRRGHAEMTVLLEAAGAR